MKRFLTFLMAILMTSSGCAINSENLPNEELHAAPSSRIIKNSLLERLIAAEQNLNKDVSLTLDLVSVSDEAVVAAIKLKNPSLQKIESLRAWISFPDSILEGKTIEYPPDSPFLLFAPGEDEFDQDSGIAKIGFSFTQESEPKEEMLIATLTFLRSDAEKMAALSFFDAREGGHTEALLTHEGRLRNVMNGSSLIPLIISPESSAE